MRTLAASAAAVLAALALVPVALADGDPASDYLIAQRQFLPFDAKVSKPRAEQLAQLLADSEKKGFPIRVAVIASKVDLGAVPVLFGKPKTYAKFLGQELFYYYKHHLVVVMPNGYGLYVHGPAPAKDVAALDTLRPPGSKDGDVLVVSAERAVQTLARRRGIQLALPPLGSGPGDPSENSDRLVLAGGLLGLAVVGALVLGAVLLVRRRRRA